MLVSGGGWWGEMVDNERFLERGEGWVQGTGG